MFWRTIRLHSHALPVPTEVDTHLRSSASRLGLPYFQKYRRFIPLMHVLGCTREKNSTSFLRWDATQWWHDSCLLSKFRDSITANEHPLQTAPKAESKQNHGVAMTLENPNYRQSAPGQPPSYQMNFVGPQGMDSVLDLLSFSLGDITSRARSTESMSVLCLRAKFAREDLSIPTSISKNFSGRMWATKANMSYLISRAKTFQKEPQVDSGKRSRFDFLEMEWSRDRRMDQNWNKKWICLKALQFPDMSSQISKDKNR